MAELKQILTFQLNDLQLALDVDDIQEVLLKGDFQDVPMAPDYIKGLFTLRGQIVTAVDLKKRFGLQGGFDENYAIIVIQKDTEYIGFIVDSVGSVEQIEPKKLKSLPANFKKEWEIWSSRIIEREDSITILPDTETIIQA